MTIKVTPSHSIKAFRYRVHALEQDLWKEQDPVSRANLAMQLADAATTLARLEMRQVHQNQQSNPDFKLY
jgi:TPP-dependent pyruvate/acetoin dehydrogenase alpha subunit